MANNKITLKDIYAVVNRLEDKMDKRLSEVEDDVDALEAFKNNLVGKITLFTGIVSICFTAAWQWVKDKLE